MEYQTLYERVKAIHSGIPTDDMGGSPLDKCYMMAYLARRFKMKTFVEIGVYRGKSLFSVAPAFLDNAGRCYGIDPWLSQNLREKELPDEVKVAVDSFADAADFDALYHEVLEKRQQLNMNDSVTILRKTAEQACAYFLEHMLSERVKVVDEGGGNDQTDVFIDMLHIDGNHDYEFVSKDARLYIPHVRQGGIVVFDDVGWSGVRRVYDQAKEQMIVLYEDCDFAVLYRDDVLAQEMRESSHPMPSWAKIRLLRMSLPALMENVRFSQNYDCEPRRLRILAAVMSYNSSDYIEECLQSIAAQQGDFDIEIAVFDDASTDDTIKRVRKLSELPGNVNITVYTKKINEGYEKNYIRVFNALRESNADFLTCIDGDDYLLSPLRIMRNINELLRRPECALSFNRLLLYYQAQSLFDLWRDQDKLSENTYTALDLAGEYFIGNGSCSTVRRNAAVGVPEDLFLKVKAGDWLAHCMYATKGDIAYIREPMNVYRKHSQGAWTGIPPRKQGDLLHKSVAEFNKLTEYLFYARLYRKQAERFQGKEMEDCTTYDLTIIDDVFPHPSSGFRAAEYGAYLSRFDNMRILCNGSSVAVLGKRLHTDIMAAYKQANPELADKLLETIHTYELPLERTLKSKLAYFCFLSNAFTSLEVVERNKIPFVFELYPGGSFQLDAISSDIMLERVLHSPCFRKVIVTQDVTKDYLLRHNLCSEDRIVSIFGVVTPRQMLETVPQPPQGGDGSRLKVCFAAMRYTPTGEDKGYDVFLETARLLAREYDNIEFHVAGAFDEYVLPLKDLTSRVVFHGVLRGTQLQAFFQEMDIIVSPNLNGCIAPGTFDGFPTATCTEAGLNGVLILCTDPLGLNNGRFANGEEIEIIQRDAGAAAERIAYYYHHRDALREIVQRQGNRIRQLYSWNVQVGQRIRILEEEIACCPDNPDYVCSIPGERTITARIFFSPYPDYFSQEDMADFQLRFSKDGIFVGQFPLGDLNKPEQYLWIYLLNEAPCGIRFESIRYGDCLLAVKESSAQYVFDGTYYFNGQEQMIYLASVKNLYPTEKYLILSGRMTKNPNLRLEAEQSGRMLCAGAVLHADKPERVAECAPIPFHYLLERDGRFSFDIELSQCPKDHGCLWLYFIANHSCSCRFDRITLNGQPLRITSSNGKQRLRKYVFDTIEPFLYFEGAPMVEEDNRLSVSGVIWIGS